jgi:hypothetical protein
MLSASFLSFDQSESRLPPRQPRHSGQLKFLVSEREAPPTGYLLKLRSSLVRVGQIPIIERGEPAGKSNFSGV